MFKSLWKRACWEKQAVKTGLDLIYGYSMLLSASELSAIVAQKEIVVQEKFLQMFLHLFTHLIILHLRKQE